MLTGATSDMPNADVVAQVRQDVYDSLSGEHLLIPQGARLIGTSGTGGGRGNRRLGVTFTRILFPDGRSIALPNQTGIDGAGYPGLKDKYDTHDSTFFRGALIGGILAYIADEVSDRSGRSVSSSVSSSGRETNYNNALNDTVEKITDKLIDRYHAEAGSPTVVVRPGYQFSVFVNHDIGLHSYYE